MSMDMQTMFVSAALFVALPLVFVWESRDSVRTRHAAVLLVLALLCGAVAVAALVAGRAAPAGWAKLMPGLVLLGAGALGTLFLSAAVMTSIALLLRDEEAVEARRKARRYSGEPVRPSFAPLSRREVEFRLVFLLGAMASFWICVVGNMLASRSTTNFLRFVGLYAGPKDPRMLSWADTPGPYMLQLMLFGLLAVGFGIWTVVEYMKRFR
jgi:hypothetical protein